MAQGQPHHFQLVQWFCLFSTPELGKHIISATGVRNKEVVRKHILQMHPNMTIHDLHEVKDPQEFEAATAELAKDPDWMPTNSQQLKDSANEVGLEKSAEIPIHLVQPHQ